ncbi:MAG: hypothetical protein JNK85_17220 [Verrucomicrobiales bacterium]|nr:hypothetical protein [Verrucomicrobiales bacterium]
MRTVIRFVALGIALVGLVFWFFGGPNLGWTKTQVPVLRKDPVTEQEYTEWQKNFVPGLDFVGAALGVAGLVFGLSWIARTPSVRSKKT